MEPWRNFLWSVLILVEYLQEIHVHVHNLLRKCLACVILFLSLSLLRNHVETLAAEARQKKFGTGRAGKGKKR